MARGGLLNLVGAAVAGLGTVALTLIITRTFTEAAAGAFFTEFAGVMRDCVPDKAALNRFGAKWQVEFLGPPLSLADQST